MKRVFKHSFLSVILALLLGAAAASETPTELLIVRSDGFFPPNEMVVGDKLIGVHIDLISAVAATLNIKVNFASYPWKRAILMLQEGQADAITYMGKTPEREAFGYFEEGNRIATTQNAFFTLRGNLPAITYSGDVHQLRPYTIGTIRGRVYYPAFDQANYLRKDNKAADEEHLLGKLMLKRFEIAIGHVSRISYYAQQINAVDKIAFLQPYSPPIANYLVFSKAKKHDQLAKRFAAAMEAFKKSEKFQEILTKYRVKAEEF